MAYNQKVFPTIGSPIEQTWYDDNLKDRGYAAGIGQGIITGVKVGGLWGGIAGGVAGGVNTYLKQDDNYFKRNNPEEEYSYTPSEKTPEQIQKEAETKAYRDEQQGIASGKHQQRAQHEQDVANAGGNEKLANIIRSKKNYMMTQNSPVTQSLGNRAGRGENSNQLSPIANPFSSTQTALTQPGDITQSAADFTRFNSIAQDLAPTAPIPQINKNIKY